MALSKTVITRQEFECLFFGTPRDLPPNKLPTGEDVLRCISNERYNLAVKVSNKRVSFGQVANTVAGKIVCLYNRASIPTRKSRSSSSKPKVDVQVSETEQRDESLPSSDVCSDSDQEFIPESPKKKSGWQMRINLKSTALTSDRYGVSDRATAAIASSVLQDFDVVTNSDNSQVVDKCKIRREKHNVRAVLSSSITENKLYFDGRKDDTIVVQEAHSKRFKRVVKEEHYVLIQEPGNIFLGHVTPNSGSAEDIATSIISYLTSNDISLDELVVIGCDGTNVNTGLKNGIIRRIETHLGKPLQWAVCLLHFNELPFRHLFQYLDGKSGPNSLKGPIGEKLIKCETLPVVQFESIDCQIPEIDKKTLSKDQKYLLEISEAIKSGECPKDLSIRDPGPLSHSRWLTTANRALRLYISQENPTAEFQEIVIFILKSYMPMWFCIKKTKLFTDGPKLVHQSIETSRYLKDELKAVIDPVIERNGFFAHPEHVMITMTQDPRKHIRELGLRRIIKARERDQKRKTIRTYVAPKLNFSATDYTELNDWTNCQFSSPPLLKDVTDDELKTYIKTEEVPKWEILSQKMPVHTQAVERSVKLVSEASAKVCGSAARDGYIRTTLKSRSTMPAFDNKRQFKLPDM
ncbi:hypothetical protein ACJJTC_006946 [Scirpophaga incertulas]